jgi:hypothetical protein
MENLLEVKGYTGQLTVTERKVIIRRKGLGGFLARGGMAGDKEIPIKSITAIEFRNANLLTNGRIQFSIHGEAGHKGSAVSAVNDENTIIFTKSQHESFAKAKALIEDLMQKAEQHTGTVVNQVSSADELKKFAELKNQGLITEEEYNKKKKDLLGI